MAKKFNVTERTIRYDIEEMNSFFSKKGFPLFLGIKNGEITVISNMHDKIGVINLDSCEYTLSPKERKYLILNELFFAKDFITIDYLAENMCVCRNTIINDLENVKDWLSEKNVYYIFLPSKGLSIKGEEKHIREAILEMFREALPLELYIGLTQDNLNYKSNFNNYFKILLNQLFQDITIKEIQNYINILQKELNIMFSDLVYIDLIIFLALSMQRIKLGNNMPIDEEEKSKFINTNVYTKVSLIFNKVSKKHNIYFMEDEIIYFSQLILASNTTTIPVTKDYPDLLEVQILIKKLIFEVGKKLNNTIIEDNELYEDLFRFVLPFIYRQKYQVRVYNPYLDEIKTNYPKTFAAVKSSINSIEKDIKVSINDSEIGYITLYFAAALEKQNEFNVLILCGTGYSIANLLSTKLKAMFNINIVDMGYINEAQKLLKKYKVDLIVSTSTLINTDIPCVIVNPLLTQEDILEIKKHINKLRINKLNSIN